MKCPFCDAPKQDLLTLKAVCEKMKSERDSLHKTLWAVIKSQGGIVKVPQHILIEAKDCTVSSYEDFQRFEYVFRCE